MPEPGTRIGPYEVLGELGRGGMGVVYLARDARLERRVAIKSLPERLASDRDRLERFEREGRTLAQLNHPNIAGIYGVEEFEGRQYLILEYVEGVTLSARLEQGAMSFDEARETALGIAAGLEAAHDIGVIHRDLKPDNIKITPDGTVKVLDFGLAKSTDAVSSASVELTQSPTMSLPNSPTMPGVIMGTAAYMSPEQARGRSVDKRTDIWSFGVVMYEMLTGASPFVGETASDSIGAVLHKAVDLQRLPPGTPASIRRVLERCLERDKSLRYRDIGDVRIELLRAEDAPAEPSNLPVSSSWMLKGALAAACIVAGTAGLGWYLASEQTVPAPLPVRKFDLMSGGIEQRTEPDRARISPDGARVAFVRDGLVHVRDFASFDARPLAGTDGACTVFWSPDSRWIGYTTNGRSIYKVALLGGGAIKVADSSSELNWDQGGGWTSDDRIVFREDDSISQVAARGGTPVPLLAVDDATLLDFHAPTVIRDTNAVLYVEHRRDGTFALAAYNGKQRTVLAVSEDEAIDTPVYSPSGHVLFVRQLATPSLWAVGFDVATMTVTSEQFLVLPDASQPSVSDDGTLLVQRGSVHPPGQIVFAGIDGTTERIGEPFEMVVAPLLSPDATKVALSTGTMSRFDVWVVDLERGTRSRLTFGEGVHFPAAWSPDSTELAVVLLGQPGASVEPSTSFYAADGSGTTRPTIGVALMSMDGQWKTGIGTTAPMSPNDTLYAISLDDPNDLSRIIKIAGANAGVISLNPAGTLMAYSSRESGETQVYCSRYPDGSGRWQVSVHGGSNPIWSHDGKTLYFHGVNDDRKIYAVDVATEPSVRLGMPREVLDAESRGLDLSSGYSVTADGQRFLTLQANEDDTKPGFISVIENWYEEYRDQ